MPREETGIAARYMGHFRTARVGMPFGGDPAEVGRALERSSSFIDQSINDNLRRLRIYPPPCARTPIHSPPAPICDILGTLPKVEETRAFLRDRAPDKRARWWTRCSRGPNSATTGVSGCSI